MQSRIYCLLALVFCCLALTGCEQTATVEYSLRTTGSGGVMVINDKINIEFAQLEACEPFTHFDYIQTIGPGGQLDSFDVGGMTLEAGYHYGHSEISFGGHEIVIESGAELTINGSTFRFIEEHNGEPWKKLDLVVYADMTVEQRGGDAVELVQTMPAQPDFD